LAGAAGGGGGGGGGGPPPRGPPPPPPAGGPRPLGGGGGPTKYHQLALRNSMREGRVLAHNSRLTHAAERMAAKEPPSTARRPKLANSPRRCGIRLPIPPS